jgi:hypothetical protein
MLDVRGLEDSENVAEGTEEGLCRRDVLEQDQRDV